MAISRGLFNASRAGRKFEVGTANRRILRPIAHFGDTAFADATIWRRMRIDSRRDPLDNAGKQEDVTMPTMSNLRRRKIQARQRKIENATKREAKLAKKEHNAKKAG